MKQTVSKVVAAALALIMVLGMASFAAAGQVLYVNQAVNVRTGPGTDYTTLGWLDKGDAVQATGNAVSGWTQIQYSTYEIGYVKNTYLSSYAPSSNNYNYSYNYSCAPVYKVSSANVTPKLCADCGATYKTTSKLNIRSGPSTGYAVIGTLSKGDQVTRVGESGKWFKILTNEGVDAYVSSAYLKAVTYQAPATVSCNTPVYSYEPGRSYNPCYTTSTSSLYATTALRVRSGPGTKYSIVGGLQRGEGVTYRGTSGSWYQITTADGVTGYAHSKYLSSSAPSVRYSNTPVVRYNNCNTCGNYYYGSACTSCYSGYNGYYNGSVFSTRPSVPSYNSSSSTGTRFPIGDEKTLKVPLNFTSINVTTPTTISFPADTKVTVSANYSANASPEITDDICRFTVVKDKVTYLSDWVNYLDSTK